MAEVLIQIASYINYAFEETLGRIDMKYWPAIRDTTSAYYLAILSTCVAVVVINVLEQRRLKNRLSQQKSTEKQNNSRKGRHQPPPDPLICIIQFCFFSQVRFSTSRRMMKSNSSPWSRKKKLTEKLPKTPPELIFH